MLRTMKCFSRIVFVVFLAFGMPLTSYALSCAQPMSGPLPLAERVEAYPVIFSGTIKELSRQSSPAEHIGREAFSVYDVTVDKAYKGLDGLNEVQLKTYASAWHLWATSSGLVPEYVVGDSYLFLIESAPNGNLVETNMNADCSQDLIIFNLAGETGQQALAQIEAIELPETPTPTPPVFTPTTPEPPMITPPAKPETPMKSKNWFERFLEVLKAIF